MGHQGYLQNRNLMETEGKNIVIPPSMSIVEEKKQPFNDGNETAVSELQAVPVTSGSGYKEGDEKQKIPLSIPVSQGESNSAELDKILGMNLTKKELIASMRDDGIPEEDIELLAEAFPEPIPPDEQQLTDADLQIRKERIADELREDGLPEEDIELLSADMAESGGPLVDNIVYSTAEMTEKFLADMEEDGLPEEDIELLIDTFAVAEDPLVSEEDIIDAEEEIYP